MAPVTSVGLANAGPPTPPRRFRKFGLWCGAVGLVVTAVMASPTITSAATTDGEVLMDCTRPGDEYLFSFPAAVQDLESWVTDAGGDNVASTVVTSWYGFWRVDVPDLTEYAKVWISDGTTTLSMDRESPACSGTAANQSTPNYGAGLTPISPQRVYDTRVAGDRLDAGGTLTVQVGGQGGVVADATAAMVNLAAIAPSAAGHLTAYPCGATRPTAAVLNHVAGETRAGASLIELDEAGRLCIYSHAAADVTVDVQGYVADSANPVAITPTRVLDTRTDGGQIDGERRIDLGTLSQLDLPFNPGVDGADVAGLFLNVASTNASNPGHLTVYADGARGNGSTARLNYEPGRAQGNLVFTPIKYGAIEIQTSSATDVIIDVVAVTRHPDAWVPVSDFRLLDSRTGVTNLTTDGRLQGVGRLQPGVPLTIPIGGRLNGLTPTAVLVNITGISPSDSTHVTAYPCGTAPPTVSSANVAGGKVVPNAVLVPIGSSSSICVVSPIETDLVIDLMGTMTTRPVGLYRSTCVTNAPFTGETIAGGTPPYVLTGDLPAGYRTGYSSGAFTFQPPDDVETVLSREMIVTDSSGQQLNAFLEIATFGLGTPPRPPC